MSPPTAQPSANKGLTKTSPKASKPKEQELVSGLFSELENDPDFMLLAERWSNLPEELKQAIVRMVK